jgi:putative membrane protein
MSDSTKEGPEKVLILCVDRDDDIGVKAKIKTPILGRKENLEAAVALALEDPEEPDANAMFEAVRIFDRMKEGTEVKGHCQIATVSGSELGGIGADRKLVSELTNVLKAFPASDVILVTDGFTDEAVLPLLQSRVPVTSVRRVIVKHSESIEETAALFSRYLKTIWRNPRYSRITLGLPGLLMIILVILYAFNQLTYFGLAFLVVLGVALIVKGFGLDRMARNFYRWAREYSPPPLPIQIANYTAIAGVVLIAISCYQGVVTAVGAATDPNVMNPPLGNDVGGWLSALPFLSGWFISQSIVFIIFGVCILLGGRAIRWFFERDPKLLRTIVIIVAWAWVCQIFYQASRILVNPFIVEGRQIDTSWAFTQLALAVVTGILLTVAAVLITFILHRRYASFFREKEGEVEEFKEN